MKYLLNHKDGLIELTVKNTNAAKNRIEHGELTARACGDCNRFLDINSFDSRVRNGKRQIHTKCNQCHRIRKLVKGSMKRFGKDTSTEKIIGIEYDLFIEWLDQGVYKHTDKGLHIDHCIPQSLGMNVEDLKILNHYSNLKLLPGKENIQKSNKYIYQTDIDRVLKYHPYPERILDIIEIAKATKPELMIIKRLY